MMCFLKHPLVLVFILWDIGFTNLFLKFCLGNSYIMVFPVTPSGRCLCLSDSTTLGDFTTFEVKEK